MQLPLITPPSNWRPPRIADLPDWGSAKRVAIDTETNDPKLRALGPGVRRGAYIAGYSFAIEDGPKHYIPIRHMGGDNVEDPAAALGWLKDQAHKFTGEIVGAKLDYDLDFLEAIGIKFPSIKYFRDVQILEALIDELQLSYSLETICQKYLDIGKNESLLREAANCYGIDPKKDLHMLAARFVGPYAEDDAGLPLLVLRRQEREAEEQDLFKIYNMESELLPVLVRMKQRGVRVDLKQLAKVEEWSAQQERMALGEIEKLTGHRIPFNSVWQASALAPVLESIGIKVPLTPKTKKPSIDKAFLAGIDHPVAKAIARARRVNKVRTTFTQTIHDHMTNGRIHCNYTQLRSSTEGDDNGDGEGARFGRGASNHPNMQQAPARDPEIGPMYRTIFIPEENEIWGSADFKSQEPRHAVHYASTTKLGNRKVHTPNGSVWVDADRSAFEMAERYRNDPSTDPHQALADMIEGRKAEKSERDRAKLIFLGLSYGMGGAKLARQLGLPTMMAVRCPESWALYEATSEQGRALVAQGQKIFETAGPAGQALLDKFDAQVPFVGALNKVCKKAANAYGYVRTAAGRKCRFERDEQGNLIGTHKALNRIVQGSAADQTKIALIALDKEGFFITVQVHDEVGASIKNREEGERLARVMEEAYKLNIPTAVDLEIGTSWGTAK